MSKELVYRPELAEALNPDLVTAGQIRSIFNACNEILDPDYGISYEDTVNGEKMRISTAKAEIVIDDEEKDARIARIDKTGDIAYLITGREIDPKNTINSYALRIIKPKKKGQNPNLLLDGVDIESLVNNSIDARLAREVFERISNNSNHNLARARRDVESTKENRKRSRNRFLGGVAVAGLVITASYYNLLWGNNDAKINDFPLPGPAEWIVDIGNQSDHQAQGFERPKGAAEIEVSKSIESIPSLEEYTTIGAPSSFNTEDDHVDELKPGLYMLDLSDDTSDSQLILDEKLQETYVEELTSAAENCQDLNAEDCLDLLTKTFKKIEDKSTKNCKIVSVNAALGRVSVFVTDPGLSDSLTASLSEKQLRVCANSGQKLPDGLVYMYQDTEN